MRESPAPFRVHRSPTEVFLAFLALGLTAFGGPIAHIGYFRNEFVVRRRWLLLIALPVLGRIGSPDARLFEAFYRSGALVFGGGHVVLPLLRDAVAGPEWISDGAFLSGYAAAQAVPGPLFTFAAYLGAVATPSHRLTGAVLGLIGIFLPGMLMLLGVLPFWDFLRARTAAQRAMLGINAAVVGLLGAALYLPVWSTSIHTTVDLCAALICFLLLTVWRAPPFLVVLLGMLAGIALPMSQA